MDPQAFEHVVAAAAEVRGDVLLERVTDLPIAADTRGHIEKMLRGIVASR